MTDNEKRAHDLAIATATVMAFRAPAGEEKYDLYAIYNNAYGLALEAVNRDFLDDDQE
jgi:hypothetical protein